MHISTAKMQSIAADLASRSSHLATVIEAHPLCTLASKPPTVSNFESLVESVVSQQLSVKAADTIYARLAALCSGEVAAQQLLKQNEDALRQAGLSAAKVKTIRGLAEAAVSGAINFEGLHELEDEVISTQLNSLWGIGPWTVDMFMMHQLHRLDIWPVGDLGVRRGWQNMFALEEKIEAEQLRPLGEDFRPYRSIGAWYCWRAA
jgi:DNA-3-methyladenine glycosylase II